MPTAGCVDGETPAAQPCVEASPFDGAMHPLAFFPAMLVAQAMAAHSVIRSFSCVLRLSPFHPIAFARVLMARHWTVMLDTICAQIMRFIYMSDFDIDQWDSPEKLGFNELDLCLMDSMTWPFYLRQVIEQHIQALQSNDKDTPLLRTASNALKTQELYHLPLDQKLALLQFMCDKIIESRFVCEELQERQQRIEQKIRKHGRVVTSKNLLDGVCYSLKENQQIDEYSDGDEEEGNSDICSVCRRGGQLICCDTCANAYHLACVSETKHSVPDGDWSCPECCIPGIQTRRGRVHIEPALSDFILQYYSTSYKTIRFQSWASATACGAPETHGRSRRGGGSKFESEFKSSSSVVLLHRASRGVRLPNMLSMLCAEWHLEFE